MSSTLDLSAEGVADVARYKRRLQSYFASQSPPLEVVFMERNTFTKGAKHAHIQVFAVAAGQGAAIAATIAQYTPAALTRRAFVTGLPGTVGRTT